MTRPVLPLVLSLCLLITWPGCRDNRLNLHNVEAMLADEYGSKAGETVEKVTCPELVPTRKGHRFDCTLRFESGRDLVVTVEQTDTLTLRWFAKEGGQASDSKSK